MDFWSSLYHALPRHVAVLSHTKPGINFKSIVRWYSLSSDNSYHYHVYSVLLLIYCVFADVDIITLVINAITAIRLLYVDRSVHQAWPVAREL